MKIIIGDQHKVDKKIILNEEFFENISNIMLNACWSALINENFEHYKAYMELYTTIVSLREKAIEEIKQWEKRTKYKKQLDFWEELLM